MENGGREGGNGSNCFYAIWQYDSMAVWQYGSMVVWQYGSMATVDRFTLSENNSP